MQIKSVQRAELCFQVRPAGKETVEYSRSTVDSVIQNTLERTLMSLHFAPVDLFNKSLIHRITLFLLMLLMLRIRKENL